MNGIAAVLPKVLERKCRHIIDISSDVGRTVLIDVAGLGLPNCCDINHTTNSYGTVNEILVHP